MGRCRAVPCRAAPVAAFPAPIRRPSGLAVAAEAARCRRRGAQSSSRRAVLGGGCGMKGWMPPGAAAGEEWRAQVLPCASRGVAGDLGDGHGPAAAGRGVLSGAKSPSRCPPPSRPGCSPGVVYSKSRSGAPGRGGVGPVSVKLPWARRS